MVAVCHLGFETIFGEYLELLTIVQNFNILSIWLENIYIHTQFLEI